MGKAMQRPEPGTQRKLTATEAVVVGVTPAENWFVEVDMENHAFLLRDGDRRGPLSTKVVALEAFWTARRPAPRRIEQPREVGGPIRAVASIEPHQWDRLRRVEVLSCDHRLTYLKTDRRRPRRHCRQCPEAS